MQAPTYNLINGDGTSNAFYNDLTKFTDRFLQEAHKKFDGPVHSFVDYIDGNAIEELRTRNEYLIEFLSLGLFWNLYHSRAQAMRNWQRKALSRLYKMRREYPVLKPKIDALRGRLMTAWLTKEKPSTRLHYNRNGLNKLLNWLEASGEYHEEVERLRIWQRYFDTLAPIDVSSALVTAARLALFFEQESRHSLGKYTANVGNFLATQPDTYRNREDVIFSGRREAEYHLNMLAAEVMNRAFKAEFKHKAKKIVLLPTCMRQKSAAECRAVRNGLDIRCSGCDKNCRVNQLNQACKEWGAETRLVPHSSQFTEWLKQYKNEPDVALVGVACVLNLLTGGYEMKNLGLASQCVFLDYCGCQKHWHPEGIATDLNEKRLRQVLNPVRLQQITNRLYAFH